MTRVGWETQRREEKTATYAFVQRTSLLSSASSAQWSVKKCGEKKEKKKEETFALFEPRLIMTLKGEQRMKTVVDFLHRCALVLTVNTLLD